MALCKNIFIVVNIDRFLLSHRKEIALAAQQIGFDVTIVTHNTGKKSEIENLGFRFFNLPSVKSKRINFFAEFRVLFFLYFLYKKYKPDIVHHVGLKLILHGTVAAKFAGIKNILNAVSGLGTFFS